MPPEYSEIDVPLPDSEERLVFEAPNEAGWLHVEHFKALKPPPALVVFCHGFSAYAAPYRQIALALRAAGFGTTLFDARGHGHSTGRRGYIRSFDDYRSDLQAVVAAAKRIHGDLPFALVGHSQGGLIVLDHLLCEGQRSQPRCAVVAAPMMWATVLAARISRPITPLLASILPQLQTSNGITAAAVTRNPELRQAFNLDPLLHHVATPRWFNESMKTQRRIQASAGRLSVPTRWYTAGQDKIVSNEAQFRFVSRTPEGIVTHTTHDDLYHEIFLEPGRDTIVANMVAWLGTQLVP